MNTTFAGVSRDDLSNPGPGYGNHPARARFRTTLPELVLDGEWSFRWTARVVDAPDDLGGTSVEGWGSIPVPSIYSMPIHGHGTPAYTNTFIRFPLNLHYLLTIIPWAIIGASSMPAPSFRMGPCFASTESIPQERCG